MQRKPLFSIELAGGRKILRDVVFYGLAAAAALGALGYVLPAHRVNEDVAFHSNYADGGVAPLVVFGVVAAIVLALRGRKLLAGVIAGAASMIGAVLAIVPVILVHMFSTVEHGFGEPLFALGVLALFFGGGLMIVAEPILFVTQRRAIERAERERLPQLPIARVL